jgi:hypothetical protein
MSSAYQTRGEEEGTAFPSMRDQEEKKPSLSWQFVAAVFAVGALGVVAVSTTSGLNMLSASETAKTRIQLASEGTIMYTSLSDDDKTSLFEDFKSDYEKEVTR